MYAHAVGFVSAFLPTGMGIGAHVCGSDSRARRRHFRRATGALWLTAVALFGCGGRSLSSERLTKEDAGNTAVAAGSADGAVGADALAEGGGLDEAGSSNASGGGADGSVPPSEAAICVVSASNYDQSCAVDTDCKPIYSGDYCFDTCMCPLTAINVQAAGQFYADINTAMDSTYYQLGHMPGPEGAACPFCPDPGACCRGGHCIGDPFGSVCHAMADAGGDASSSSPVDTPNLNYTVLCVSDAGPTDSGAAVPGLSRWCDGPEVCAPFNGGWECCGPTMGTFTPCIAP